MQEIHSLPLWIYMITDVVHSLHVCFNYKPYIYIHINYIIIILCM